MFTGIVEEVGTVGSVTSTALSINANLVLDGIKPGGSIAVNGVCLTVTGFTSRSFNADIMPETLRKTNLGTLHPGDKVNLESALALGGELGGHLVQGHIDGTAKIESITPEGGAFLVKFKAPSDIMRYIVPKGFIAVDGMSLTITEKNRDSFGVSIVEYTWQHTALAGKRAGDIVNLEADIIGKYVAEILNPQSTGITAEFLKEHGFQVN